MNESQTQEELPASAAEERAALSFLRLPAGTDDDMPCTPAVPMPPGQSEKAGNPATQQG